MFVQEEKIFAAKVLRLRVCALDGAEWLEEVAEDTAVERLKERCGLKHVRGLRGGGLWGRGLPACLRNSSPQGVVVAPPDRLSRWSRLEDAGRGSLWGWLGLSSHLPPCSGACLSSVCGTPRHRPWW